MRRQEQLRLEQLDEGPRIGDLRVGDRVHLIGDDGDIDRAELSASARTPGVIGPALPMSTALKPEGKTRP
jgi:hypothetical protein